jgi:hypothetical protein
MKNESKNRIWRKFMKKGRRKINWDKVIAEYGGSGKSQRQFCIENNIPLSTFNTKMSAEKKKVLTSQAVWSATEITVKKSKLEISTGKFKITIYDFSKEMLFDVMVALDRLC